MQIAFWRKTFGLALALSAAASGLGQTYAAVDNVSLAQQVQALVAAPAVSRAHWGVMVTTMDGAPIYAMNEGQLFQPASNAKLFTTAAALALLGPASRFDTRVEWAGILTSGVLTGDLVLIGDGDPNISGRRVPYLSPGQHSKTDVPQTDPLYIVDDLARQIAASGVKEITGDIIGDDTLFPYEPYATDWAIDDTVWGYGAPVSALSINDNQIKLTVKPAYLPPRNDPHGAGGPNPAPYTLEPALPYYTVDDQIDTLEPKSKASIGIDRAIGSRSLRLFGTIAADASSETEEIAIADPAEYAAMALKAKLEALGVVVRGKAVARHRTVDDAQDFLEEVSQPVPEISLGPPATMASCLRCVSETRYPHQLAAHRSSPVAEDVVVTNKVSQNLHAELLLHQISVTFAGDRRAGSTAQGVRVIRQFLLNAGINKDDFVFYDGSGLSGHDLVTPRAIAKLLQFASTQPWFADYKSSLPIGGVDGSLESRFTKPPLKGHVFAKTGTLGEARALSGYLECASGRTVIFSIMVGNHTPGSSADRDAMDRIVAAIAAAN